MSLSGALGQNHNARGKDQVGLEVDQDKVRSAPVSIWKTFQVLLPGRVGSTFWGECKPNPFLVRSSHSLNLLIFHLLQECDFHLISICDFHLLQECDAKHGTPHLGESRGKTHIHLPHRVSVRDYP